MMPHLNASQAWGVLSVAILFEVAGTTCLRLSEGFSRLTPSLLIFVFYGVSFALNAMVVRTLGLSIVYAVWSGAGTVLSFGLFALAWAWWIQGAIRVRLSSCHW